jgi:hypothetical protein
MAGACSITVSDANAQTATIAVVVQSVVSPDSKLTTTPVLRFFDETGVNPISPGVGVSVALATTGEVVGSGFVGTNGAVTVPVRGATAYVATFTGSQAPKVTAVFAGSAVPSTDTIVSVIGHRSPSLSLTGYTQTLAALYPKGWVSDTALQPGGNAYAGLESFGSALAQLDFQAQQLTAAARLATAQGSDIDSWAYDFFGTFLLRYLGEDDATYLSRVLAAFGPRLTLAAIEQIVNQFFVATLQERIAALEVELGFDTTGGYDTRGGYDIIVPPPQIQALIPVVSCWDKQSNPTLATLYSVAEPQFVISIGFTGAVTSWFLDHSHLDIETFLVDGNTVSISSTPPDPRLGALVNLVKAAGYSPLYSVYSN